jgi:hypothetical protein
MMDSSDDEAEEETQDVLITVENDHLPEDSENLEPNQDIDAQNQRQFQRFGRTQTRLTVFNLRIFKDSRTITSRTP